MLDQVGWPLGGCSSQHAKCSVLCGLSPSCAPRARWAPPNPHRQPCPVSPCFRIRARVCGSAYHHLDHSAYTSPVCSVRVLFILVLGVCAALRPSVARLVSLALLLSSCNQSIPPSPLYAVTSETKSARLSIRVRAADGGREPLEPNSEGVRRALLSGVGGSGLGWRCRPAKSGPGGGLLTSPKGRASWSLLSHSPTRNHVRIAA